MARQITLEEDAPARHSSSLFRERMLLLSRYEAHLSRLERYYPDGALFDLLFRERGLDSICKARGEVIGRHG